MAKSFRRTSALLLLLCTAALPAFSQARFDLTGPRIDITVNRAGVDLPIASVPNLQPGDQLRVHPDLPPTQSVKYLLVIAFLRGTTNPPPDDWFTRVETWNRHVRDEGVTVTVPNEAQQAILFLAPETGGDFSTLRSAVKGTPGIFVRADQDLIEAGFEQARIEKYLAEMKKVPPGDQTALTEHSNLLARTLNLKPNPECFKRPLDQQYNCLTQTGTQSLLDDGHGKSMVDALSNGATSDFINQASYTQLAGAGTYSAYVGAIVDLVRLTSGLHTAHYRYIPAIAFPTGNSLNLRLNTPPSFNNPKSVIVIGLPAVQPAVTPPLRAAEPDHISCLLNPKMVLPIDGAPLVFSTAFAQRLVLHLNLPAGTSLPGLETDIPLTPDAYQGGLTVDHDANRRKELPPASPDHPAAAHTIKPEIIQATVKPKPSVPIPAQSGGQTAAALPGTVVTGTVRGMWGFDTFTGPTLSVQALPGGGWHIVKTPTTTENLIAGQPNHLEIASTGTACIQSIDLESASTEPVEKAVEWKLNEKSIVSPEPTSGTSSSLLVHPVDLTLNLQHAASPGSIQLAIQQYGRKTPDQLGTKTFAQPARVESVQYHTGDSSVTLTGSGLLEVKQVTLQAGSRESKEMIFLPQPASSDAKPPTSLTLNLPDGIKPQSTKPEEKLAARILLDDGRTLDAATVTLAPRPAIAILSRRTVAPPGSAASPIQLSSPNELPLGSQLLFFLKSRSNFPRTEQIEIASADDSLSTTLNLKDSTLVLQDNRTVLATFDPLKLFGPSSFGPFRLRPVTADGAQGEWQPLATVVRLPTLTQLTCSNLLTDTCLLTGQALYLIDSLSATPDFANPTPVPEGFVDTTLAVPRPVAGSFYLRLRDDPTAVQQVTMPVTPALPAAPAPRASSHTSGPR